MELSMSSVNVQRHNVAKMSINRWDDTIIVRSTEIGWRDKIKLKFTNENIVMHLILLLTDLLSALFSFLCFTSHTLSTLIYFAVVRTIERAILIRLFGGSHSQYESLFSILFSDVAIATSNPTIHNRH